VQGSFLSLHLLKRHERYFKNSTTKIVISAIAIKIKGNNSFIIKILAYSSSICSILLYLAYIKIRSNLKSSNAYFYYAHAMPFIFMGVCRLWHVICKAKKHLRKHTEDILLIYSNCAKQEDIK